MLNTFGQDLTHNDARPYDRAMFYDDLCDRLHELAVWKGDPDILAKSNQAHAKAEEIRAHDSSNPHMG